MIRAASAPAACYLLAMLVACSPAPAQESPISLPAAAAETPAVPADLKSLEASRDWQYGDGAELNAAWSAGVETLLGKMNRSDVIAAITDAGFECQYGEAHEAYPDPMAVCTRSFATRACQMDWEIASTADQGMVDEVDGMFRRDCVGIDRDWPEPKRSAIDDQLAPATLPAPPT